MQQQCADIQTHNNENPINRGKGHRIRCQGRKSGISMRGCKARRCHKPSKPTNRGKRRFNDSKAGQTSRIVIKTRVRRKAEWRKETCGGEVPRLSLRGTPKLQPFYQKKLYAAGFTGGKEGGTGSNIPPKTSAYGMDSGRKSGRRKIWPVIHQFASGTPCR